MLFDQLTAASVDLTPERMAYTEILATYINDRTEDSEGIALELGAGKGALSLALKDRFRHIDMLDALYHENNFPEIHLPEHLIRINNEFYEFSMESTYDAVYSSLFLHHLRDEKQGLGRMCQLLKSGGKLYICDLYTEDGRFHPDSMHGIYHHGFDPDHLANLLKREDCAINNIETIFSLEKNGRDYPVFMLECTKM